MKMFYCERCDVLCDTTTCPKCGSFTRMVEVDKAKVSKIGTGYFVYLPKCIREELEDKEVTLIRLSRDKILIKVVE